MSFSPDFIHICERIPLEMLAFVFLVALAISEASVPVCITNCVQCKQMFGPYFEGRACGDACLASKGALVPDCNNPRTLGGLLKRLY